MSLPTRWSITTGLAYALLVGAAAAWPLAARAQQISRPARLGYIWIGAKNSEHSTRDGLRQGLRDLGYVEGQDFILEERYAESQPDRLPEIVAELVRLRVALFLSPGVQVTRALVAGGRISFIRDYRYVRYVVDDAELVLAPDTAPPSEGDP